MAVGRDPRCRALRAPQQVEQGRQEAPHALENRDRGAVGHELLAAVSCVRCLVGVGWTGLCCAAVHAETHAPHIYRTYYYYYVPALPAAAVDERGQQRRSQHQAQIRLGGLGQLQG